MGFCSDPWGDNFLIISVKNRLWRARNCGENTNRDVTFSVFTRGNGAREEECGGGHRGENNSLVKQEIEG